MYRRRGGGSDFCTFICNVSVTFSHFVNILLLVFTVSSWWWGSDFCTFICEYYVSVVPLQCVNILQHNVSSAWWGSDYCTFICYQFLFLHLWMFSYYDVSSSLWGSDFVHIHMQCISLFSPAVCEHTPVYHVVIVYSIVVVVRFWFLHIH